MSFPRLRRPFWEPDAGTEHIHFRSWLQSHGPRVYAAHRAMALADVESALRATSNLTKIDRKTIANCPEVLELLRVASSPPLSSHQLAGAATSPWRGNLEVVGPNGIEPALQGIRGLLDQEILDAVSCFCRHQCFARAHAIRLMADRLTNRNVERQLEAEWRIHSRRMLLDYLTRIGYTEVSKEIGDPVTLSDAGTCWFESSVDGESEQTDLLATVRVQPMRYSVGRSTIVVCAPSTGAYSADSYLGRLMHSLHRRNHTRDGGRVVVFLSGIWKLNALEFLSEARIDWYWGHRPNDLLELCPWLRPSPLANPWSPRPSDTPTMDSFSRRGSRWLHESDSDEWEDREDDSADNIYRGEIYDSDGDSGEYLS